MLTGLRVETLGNLLLAIVYFLVMLSSHGKTKSKPPYPVAPPKHNIEHLQALLAKLFGFNNYWMIFTFPWSHRPLYFTTTNHSYILLIILFFINAPNILRSTVILFDTIFRIVSSSYFMFEPTFNLSTCSPNHCHLPLCQSYYQRCLLKKYTVHLERSVLNIQ